MNLWGQSPEKVEEVTAEADENERKFFALRTREGLDASGHPKWISVLDRFADEGIVVRLTDGSGRYRLTERGTEVCDSVLAELLT